MASPFRRAASLLCAAMVSAPCLVAMDASQASLTAIEKGLIQPDFRKPAAIFDRAFYQAQPKHSLAEAMAMYKVPGMP